MFTSHVAVGDVHVILLIDTVSNGCYKTINRLSCLIDCLVFLFQAAIKDGIKLEPSPQKSSLKAGGGSGWMTMAAVGVGVFVVGALAIR